MIWGFMHSDKACKAFDAMLAILLIAIHRYVIHTLTDSVQVFKQRISVFAQKQLSYWLVY
ncbi:hypothetical protein HanPSC8_Chr10g0426311 [Helianthus annuus]|nr:hypothetical protein HanPSC8_Chr10g0426311 [Helianthus annuus]